MALEGKKWIARHKMLTAVIVVVCLVAIGGATYGSHHKNTTTPSNQNDSSSSLKVGSSPNTQTTQDTLAQWKADPQYQNPLTGISYDELFRNSDKYKGQFVHFTGEVIQVLGDTGKWNLRVNITQTGTAPYTYWQDTVFVYSYSPDRVIEKDIIDFTAQVNGVITYKSVLGGDITIPSLTIYEQNVIGRAN